MNPDKPDPPKANPNDIVVFMVRREMKCAKCGKELFDGYLPRLEEDRPLCLDCAALGHLEFLTARKSPRSAGKFFGRLCGDQLQSAIR